MSRTASAKKNIFWGVAGQMSTVLLTFILRTLFARYLSKELLGVNSLYSDVLQFLNMAELGIGTALNFSLYEPVVKGDREKIKSYMQMYRKAYHVIAAIVAVMGIALSPFLKYIIKNPGYTIRELTIYYFIFLFNTVTSYFVTYKYSLANAEQKNYIQTNIFTLTKIIVTFLQIIVVAVTKNFLLFLLTDTVVQLIQKIFAARYLDRMYPYLREKNVKPLTQKEHDTVWSKTKALIFLKVGDVARLQTDSIIISSFIEVGYAGIVNNYNLVINSVASFANILFNSVISSFGNLIATESKDKQYKIFKVYKFVEAWVYGFTSVGFMVLLTPLIRLWFGDEWAMPSAAVYLILFDYYFKGERIILSNFKTAAGVFEQDKYIPFIQGIVNLILSIALVQTPLGITGIYIGTIISGIIANLVKPFIIYRVCFARNAIGFFVDSGKYLISLLAVLFACNYISGIVMAQLNIITFIEMIFIVTIIFNGVYLLLYFRTEEFRYLFGKVRKMIGR